jgi:cation transport regulator
MPYATNQDLPSSVRRQLPEHAQDIFRAAFNNAFKSHAGDVRQEEIAFRTAWAAVKRVYAKGPSGWAKRKVS